MTHRNDDYKKARKGPFGMRLTPKVRLNPLKFKGTGTVTKTAEENAASVVKTTLMAREANLVSDKARKMRDALVKARDFHDAKDEIDLAARYEDTSLLPAESLATLFDILMSVGD